MSRFPETATAVSSSLSGPETPARQAQATTAPVGMIIINADDWGGWKSATDAIFDGFTRGRISSASAMVFMEDSERAAELAGKIGLDVGLHVNLNQDFSGANCPVAVRESQGRIRRFLKRSKYAQLLYNPLLRKQFRDVYRAQANEFIRLYGRQPSHVDGHRHMHLCANMLFDRIIPPGQKVRRSFSFWPGEKSRVNRAYRSFVDKRLARDHKVTDFFFALSQCLHNDRLERVEKLAANSNVELMTHPEKPDEYEWLMGDDCLGLTQRLRVLSYAQL